MLTQNLGELASLLNSGNAGQALMVGTGGVPTVGAGGGGGGAGIPVITATVASNALTIGVASQLLSFRNASLSSGAVNTITAAPSNLVVPSGATLGTIPAKMSRIVVLELNNAGTAELAVVNISGGVNLDETTLISTTAINSGSTAANVVYSTTARTSLPFRVVGYVESTQTTAGTWATAPSTIQGAGGQALAALSSLGYGQTWQNVLGSRASGTTYYNTTGRPIVVWANGTNATNSSTSWSINGTIMGYSASYVSGSPPGSAPVSIIVPAGSSYSLNGTAAFTYWSELR